jgi:hypothetical protein
MMVLQKNKNHPTLVYSLREQGILLLPVGTISHLLFSSRALNRAYIIQ